MIAVPRDLIGSLGDLSRFASGALAGATVYLGSPS